MVNLKKIGLKESVLLLALLFCVSFAGRAGAIDLALPLSIHEILSPEQIGKVRASNALKTVQQSEGRKTMKNQIVNNVPAMRKMMGARLGRTMNSKLSAQVEKKTILKSEAFDSEPTIQATSASDAVTTKNE
ncbi:hypothetical protein VU11_03690 [Desulfobulbus sp. US2]|nr:hypothetical protein [Desulfobulbus sp. US4]MCW5207762.1 hypothetical protein [Desulfobulbus sp. US2]